MKKIITLLTLLLSFTLMYSQKKGERRIYYLDCTQSMIWNGIWDDVRENLKLAIDNVTDETTELYVIAFTDDKEDLKVFSAKATDKEKRDLKNKIDALKTRDKCNTMHSVPLQDFFDNRLDSNKINYMFLMTDGKNNKGDPKKLLMNWEKIIQNNDVYGFYVMLCPEANDKNVEHIIDSQRNFWNVKTADININIVRLGNGIFNVRNDKYVDIPFTGNLSLSNIKVEMEVNDYYELKKMSKEKSCLRLEIIGKKDLSKLPENTITKIRIKDNNDEDLSFIVTDLVEIKCINKKEYALKLNIL